MKRSVVVLLARLILGVVLFWQNFISIDIACAEAPAQPKAKVDAKPGPQPKAKTIPKPQPKEEVKQRPQQKAGVKPRPQPKGQAKPQRNVTTKPKLQPKAEAKPEPRLKVTTNPKPQPKTGVKPKPNVAAKQQPQPKAAAEPKPKPQPKVQAKPQSKTKQARHQPAQPAPAAALKDAVWTDYHYKLANGPKSKHFNLRFSLKPKSQDTPVNARVLLNVADNQNYYFVQFANNEVQVGRVEGGIEWPLGAKSAFTFTKAAADVLIKRRTSDIVVFINGKVAARAYDNTFSGRRIGFGSLGDSAAYKVSKPQAIGEVYYADDFMRVSGELGGWELLNGKWDVTAIRNPTKSANAFTLAGASTAKSASATVTTGYSFWDNYSLRVALRGKETKPIGVYFYYRDANDYYLFKWSGPAGGKGEKQLIKKFHGKETILAQAKGGYRPNQWYELRVDTQDSATAVYIDDHPIFRVADLNLSGGKVGLYTECKDPAQFDDVLVTGLTAFADDFSTHVSGKWIELGGDWRVAELPDQKQSGGKNPVLQVAASGAAKAVCGEGTWHDYTFSVDAQRGVSPPTGRGDVGIAFYYLDEASYYLWRQRWTPPKHELVKVVNGKEHIIAATDGQTMDANRHRITADVNRGVITILVDSKKVCEAWDADLSSGRIGLYATNAAAFDNAKVEFRNQERMPISTLKEIFSAEQSMSNWSAARSDWIEKKQKVGAQEITLSWHRANIPGDAEMVVELGKDAFDAEKGEVKMIIGATTETPGSGYTFAVSKSQTKWAARLGREGQPKAEKGLPKSESPSTLELRRQGALVVAYVDEDPIIVFKDPQPLKGDKVAWSASGAKLKAENIKIFCENVIFDNFDKSWTEWRPAGGTWKVTNRWQCDPRWSFFAGWPKVQGMKKSTGASEKENRAILWHKRIFNGDLTLEFAAGVKMDYAARPNYAFSRDLNATICADGKNLDSGYSFVFAGWKNQKTAIVRGDKIVAEAPKPRIEGSIHRRWWYFKIEKKGGQLRYWIDNQLVLEYNDPKPLPGNRIAIWTYDSGITLSRVRIACTNKMSKESLSLDVPQVCQCFYDTQHQVAKK